MEQRLEYEELYKVAKSFHEKESIPDVPVQHPHLIPRLRPYQEKAVQWLIKRETEPVVKDAYLDLGDYGASTSNETKSLLHVAKIPSGGILSDEMGLGKTVEVLACILNNPRTGIAIPLKSSNKDNEVEENKMDDEEVFERNSEMTLAERKHEREMRAQRRAKEKGHKNNFNDTEEKEKTTKKTAKKRTKEEKDTDYDTPQPSKMKHSAVKQAAQLWYESKLSEVNHNPIRAYYETMAGNERRTRDRIVQCVCGDTDAVQILKCKSCSRWLHKKCIGAQSWSKSHPVYCPQCWLKQSPIQSRATLIVSPKSISGQWLSEVKNHISKGAKFKVLVYKGVKIDGFLQPYNYCDYDLILTTYDVLRSELDLAETHERKSLRFEKKYFSPTCPLLCVNFWRICLDEAQMVEGHATKAADMVSRLVSVHRWAVTGTPIQKTLQDLYGLIKFLCIDPYGDLKSWNAELFSPYCDGDKRPLLTLMARVLWRSSKSDVLDQIQIPPQTELLWWHNFSPVEEHFYLRTHQECSNEFLSRLAKYKSLNLSETLDSLKVVDVNYILAPLLKLRQACSHPQAVRGNQITAQKSTMTMTELLEALIKKTTIEAQDALRKHIASLNGMAALHILCNEFVTAAEKYREVLRITEEYKGRVKVDTLQSIHTLHNLSEIIEENRGIIPPTLRDDQLRDEAKQLEEKYLTKAAVAVASEEESLEKLSASVHQLEEQMSGEDSHDWWVKLCHFLDREELLMRVHDALVNHRKSVPDVSNTSIINKVSTIQGFHVTCYQWLENLEKNQYKVRVALKELRTADTETLVNSAVDCHLRISNLKSKAPKSICQLCSCENLLKKYEMDLFDIKSKKNENVMVGDVYLLGQGKEGSWKPSEQETALKTLLAFGKHKRGDKKLLDCGTVFFKVTNALRREFKPLRLLWSLINERTCAQDELNMCKLRLRLRYPDEPVPDTSTHVNKRKKQVSNLSSNLDTKMENLHIIEPHQIEQMAHQNQLEAISALSELKKKSGTVAYLQNLRSRDNTKSNVEVCPICRCTLERKWSVLSCGHCYCMDCVSELFKKNLVHCAVCRETTNFNEVSFVNFDPDGGGCGNDAEGSNIVIPSVEGSHSTKVEAIIRRIFYLKATDPFVKVLIFSTWDRVLDVLEEALGQNGVSHLRLKPGTKYESTLEKFKNVGEEETVTALLLLVKLGSKGLNLTEATHVMMVEPLLNPSEELQAIGRVHRIGQTRPTFVHRFLIKETIEDRMFSAVQATGKGQCSGQQVTLQQLKDLFSVTSPVAAPLQSNSETGGGTAESPSIVVE